MEEQATGERIHNLEGHQIRFKCLASIYTGKIVVGNGNSPSEEGGARVAHERMAHHGARAHGAHGAGLRERRVHPLHGRNPAKASVELHMNFFLVPKLVQVDVHRRYGLGKRFLST